MEPSNGIYTVCIDDFNLEFGNIDSFLRNLSNSPYIDYGEWNQEHPIFQEEVKNNGSWTLHRSI